MGKWKLTADRHRIRIRVENSVGYGTGCVKEKKTAALILASICQSAGNYKKGRPRKRNTLDGVLSFSVEQYDAYLFTVWRPGC